MSMDYKAEYDRNVVRGRGLAQGLKEAIENLDVSKEIEGLQEVLVGIEQSLDAILVFHRPDKHWEYVYADSLRQMDALGREGWRFKVDMSYIHTDGRREPIYLMEREVPQ